MTPLGQISYDEFGKLRFLDFFPRTRAYSSDDIGGLECGIGIACSEGYGSTYFARPPRSKQTAEIGLDFDNDCPETEGHALLEHLGLKLRRGISVVAVKKVLGTPETERPRWLRFVVGRRWPYYVGCLVDDDRGLCRVWVCRRDLADKEQRVQNGQSAS
jgi:hypothetical protein